MFYESYAGIEANASLSSVKEARWPISSCDSTAFPFLFFCRFFVLGRKVIAVISCSPPPVRYGHPHPFSSRNVHLWSFASSSAMAVCCAGNKGGMSDRLMQQKKKRKKKKLASDVLFLIKLILDGGPPMQARNLLRCGGCRQVMCQSVFVASHVFKWQSRLVASSENARTPCKRRAERNAPRRRRRTSATMSRFDSERKRDSSKRQRAVLWRVCQSSKAPGCVCT